MFKAEFWIFSTLFAVGVIVGLSYLLLNSNDLSAGAARYLPAKIPRQNGPRDSLTDGKRSPADSNPDPNDHDVDVDLNDPTFATHQLREEGDLFLRAGNYVAAATRYKELQQLNGRFTSDLSLRLAFCSEFDLQPGAAAAHFRRAIESHPTAIHRWLALSGLSRTWIERGNRFEALQILCDLMLDSLGTSTMPREIQAQVNYQLSSTLQDIALQNYHYDLSQSDGVAFQTTAPQLDKLVFLLNQLPPSNEIPEPGSTAASTVATPPASATQRPLQIDEPPHITILQRPTPAIDLTVVNVRSRLEPIAILTKHLAAACELELFASPQAQLIIAGRSKSLNVNDIQVSLLLDSLLLPLNLIWYQDAAGLHLVSLEENAPQTADFWTAAMERTLRRFNVAFPGDYRAASVLMSRANLNFIQGNLDRAANQYQELANQNPKGELLAKIFFNTGKVEMRLGRNEEAIRSFYHTVDQTYDTGFQSTAYWLVGQLSLETNHLDEAIKTAGRSLSTARIDQQKRLAALTMARAYLLLNKPFSANQVLFDNRHSFAGTDLEATASVLGCYARFVGVSDKSSLQAESQRLLSAVAMAKDKDYENFLDIYIAARAWQELGFQEKAIEKLTLAADSTTISAWRRQFLFELGVQSMIADKLPEAIDVFEFLIDDEPDPWLDKSLLQLAQLYVQTNRFHDCITVCERLLKRELNETDKHTTLNTMGRAYRDLGENHSAALCFAGMIPATSE